MGSLTEVVRRHPVAVFVVLAYALSWTLVPFGGLLGCGPFLAALVVLGILEGRSGMRSLARRMVQWRVGWGWYAAAVLLPSGVAALAAVLTVALGAPEPTGGQLASWTEIPFTFVLVLLVPLFGPWEEPGFRGFALSRLAEQHSSLAAALLVGAIHVGFHVPLSFTGDIPPSDAVFVMAASVVFAWLVVGSGGSVLVAMVMHAANNAVSGEFVSPLFSGADGERLGWIRALLWCLVALLVVPLAGRRFRAGPPAEPHVPPPAPS
jgi:membrane protease YdiL (CAAX protease family)